MIAKNYFVIGIICLIVACIFSVLGIVAYVSLKKAEWEAMMIEPSKHASGSSIPPPADGFFWQRNGLIVMWSALGIAFLLKGKTIKNRKNIS